MSNTVKQLGFIPKNRGEFDTTGQTRYYKDNVVQYRNGSYICTPVGYSSSNLTAYTTDAPYQDGDTELNPNWELMASVGLIDDEPTAGSDNLVKSGGVYGKISQLGQKVNDLNDAVNIEYPETPTYTVTSGYYISNTGVLSQNAYNNMTSLIEVHKGDKITFVGKANGGVACIAETDANQTSYTPRVIGTTDSVEATYAYTFKNDAYCVISYYRLTSLSLLPADNIKLLQLDVQQLKTNEQNYQVKSSLVTSVNSESTNNTYPSSKAVYDFGKDANVVGSKVVDFLPCFDALTQVAVFDGSTSVGTCSAIELSSDGDLIEIEVKNIGAISGNQLYGLANRGDGTVSIAVDRSGFAVRASDNTFIVNYTSFGEIKTSCLIKIVYEEGKIKTYINDVLKSTYNGQKTIRITQWGKYNSSTYWKGQIGYIKIGSTKYGSLKQLSGWSSTTVGFITPNGFLTDEQVEKLDSIINYPRCVVSYFPTGGTHSIGVFIVFVRFNETDIYYQLDLTHLRDDTDEQYYNLWRIRTNGGVYKYNSDGTFTDLNKAILIGSENEFAFQYQGTADHTGGYHGDERIDSDGCFAKFFIDGIEVTTEQMQEQFRVECESFYMLQRSSLHETKPDGGSVNPNHSIIAYHIKKTEFGDNGFTCTNRLNIDLTNSTLDSITTTSLYSGLVCVNKNCATNTYLDDGIIRDTSAGDESGVNYASGVTGKVCFFNQNTGLSCIVDSYEISLENCLNKLIRIADRVGDTKYYRCMTNRTFVTGDKYMCVSKASWSYKV